MNIDRLSIRQRPPGRSLMRQNWGKLLFIHWRIDAKLLRPLIPAKLEIDLFEGAAWIAIVPFTMWGIRASFLPPIPGTSAFHELNVRTYVHLNGVPGVWFFSLDAASRLAVWGARTFYHLPYYYAKMDLQQSAKTIDYSSTRDDPRGPAASLEATWTIGDTLPATGPDSLEFFLTERYCLYSEHDGQIYRSRIHHPQWPLQSAALLSCESTMLEGLGLTEPADEPHLRYAEKLEVDIWGLERVG